MTGKDTWFEMDVLYPGFQQESWRNGETGEVVVVEQHVGGPEQEQHEYRAVVLQTDFVQEPEPTEVLANKTSLHGASRTARDYRKNAG